MNAPRAAPLGLLVACTVALTGCGLQPSKGSSKVTLTITRDFGAVAQGRAAEANVPGAQTLLTLLSRFFKVLAGTSGGTVSVIGGHAAAEGRAWFYFVNGIATPAGATNQSGLPVTAANATVHVGDQVWWDLHDASAAQTIPAVVGSFPEPFVHGHGGKRYPTTIECGAGVQSSCDAIGAVLRSDGVPTADQTLGTGSGADTLGIVVAPWAELHGSIAADLIAHGPKHSGVYARFTAGGAELQLLDPRGAVLRTLGRGAGLVAATSDQVNQPEWVITGTDLAGVRAAAAALTPSKLKNHFAIAVIGTRVVPLPLDPGR
ncbi:MAG: hypothetical protein ACYDHH_29575 [Solirubrobacteraceae bacterium]